MISMASDAAEVQSKMQVVFGKELPKLQKNLDAFSEATGASRYALREQAADLGALLGPLTGSKKATADLSEQFVKLATDLGSFNNVPVADALLAIRSGLVGEAEPLRRFGVLLNEAAVKQEALRLGLIKGKEELTEQQKVQARASLIMQQTSQAQDDATRTAGSFSNQMKALRNSVADAATDMGTKLLPIALELVSWINQHMPEIEQVVSQVFGAAGRAVDALRPTFERVKVAVTDFVTAAQGVAPTMQAIAGAALSNSWGQAIVIAGAAMWAFNAAITAVIARLVALRAAFIATGAAMALTPIGALTVAVGVLTAAFLLTRDTSGGLTGALNRQRDAALSLKDATNQLADAQHQLKGAKISLKQATLDVTAALQRRNQLESEGKTKSNEYKQAQLDVQRAYLSRLTAEKSVSDAQDKVGQTARSGAEGIAKLKTQMDAARDSVARAAGALGQWGNQAEKKQVVANYAIELDKVAKKADAVATAAHGVSPKIEAAAKAFSAQAKAAAEVARTTGEIPAAFHAVVGPSGAAGKRIGSALGAGIAGGIAAYIGSIRAAAANAVNQAEAAARGAADAHSPSRTWQQLGRDMIQGATNGLASGQAGLASKAAEVVRNATTKAADAVKEGQAKFADAWAGYSSAALAVFDDLTSKVKTKSEKLLAALDLKQAIQGLNKDIADAQAQVQQAQIGVTLTSAMVPDESLDQWAARNKEAQDALVAAQDQLNVALLAKKRFGLEQQAVVERAALDERIKVDRIRFEEWLSTRSAQQQIQVAKEGEGQKAILKKIASYDPHYRIRGQQIGESLAIGLLDMRGKVEEAALELANAVAKALGVAYTYGKTAVGDAEAKKDQGIAGIKTAAFSTMSAATTPTTAMPLSTGGTTINVTLSAPNYVGAKEELIEVVRSGLYDVARRNPRALPGVA